MIPQRGQAFAAGNTITRVHRDLFDYLMKPIDIGGIIKHINNTIRLLQ